MKQELDLDIERKWQDEGLSYRVSNILEYRLNIHSLRQLTQLTESDLYQIRQLRAVKGDNVCMREIKRYLAERSLSLKADKREQ